MINKYAGCFYGLAIGDAYGADYEGGFLERLIWKSIGKTKNEKKRFTDDTQMSMDVAQSFLISNGMNQEHLSQTFANSYRWSRGYGPGAAWLLKKIKKGAKWSAVNRVKFKDGSYGNGAAMRAPIVAMCYSQGLKELNEAVIKCSEITHAHPLAIEGAKLVAFVTYTALKGWPVEKIVKRLPDWCDSTEFYNKVNYCSKRLDSTEITKNSEIKRHLGNGIAAIDSCVTAIYFALKYRHKKNDIMLERIFSLRGDADTIGAMAGAIWGAFNGKKELNPVKINNIESSDELGRLSVLVFQHQLKWNQ